MAVLPPALPVYAVAALLGALAGTHLAVPWFSPAVLQQVLALVLLAAGAKLLPS